MKVTREGASVTVELTRRNLTVLLAKLDDPLSARTIYKASDDGLVAWIKAVEDDDHYADRPAGEMYMPSTGETL